MGAETVFLSQMGCREGTSKEELMVLKVHLRLTLQSRPLLAFLNSKGNVLKELGAGPAVFSKVKARLDARNLLWHLESLGSHSSDIMESRMMQPSWQLLPEPLTHGSTSHVLEPGRGVERALQKNN